MEKTTFIAPLGKQEIFVTRIFDAPKELVFEASRNPKLITKWWGPGNLKTTVDKLEAKVGGIVRLVQTDPEGNVFAFRGVFHEITPERTVQTFEFEGMKGHVLLQISTLEDIGGGKTKLTIHTIAESVADRDGVVQSGMEKGIVESHERLDELLREMKKGK